MLEGIIGKKVGMTQTFGDNGNVFPVTIITAGPCTVIQRKTMEKDGYVAVQIGFNEKSEVKHVNKPLEGHFNKAGVPPVKFIREFPVDAKSKVKEGDQIFVDMFSVGDKVDVIGTSKGKGFAGVMKRWGHRGGKETHGSMFHRRPGSIGASAYPSRVMKGKKLPGRMGNERVGIKNLTVIETDKEKNLLVVKGAVPGAAGGYLLIKKSKHKMDTPTKGKEE
jgi:large subunit ribosomal protein L3